MKSTEKTPATEPTSVPDELLNESAPTVIGNGALTTGNAGLPTVLDIPEEEIGAGTEDLARGDVLVPWVRVLHYSCPEITEGDPRYIRGAKPGLMFNIATGQIYDNCIWNTQGSNAERGLPIIPVMVNSDYVEWRPIKAGGGFIGRHAEDSSFVREAKGGKDWFEPIPLTNGHELIETKYLYYLIEDEGSLSEAVTAFSSTRIKGFRAMVSRDRNIRYRNRDGKLIKPPLWMHQWRLFTVPTNNDSGRFFIYKVMVAGDVAEPPMGQQSANIASRIERDDPRYQAGWEFYKMLVGHPDAAGRAVTAQPEREGDPNEIPF